MTVSNICYGNILTREDTNFMIETKKRIQKIAKILRIICILAAVFLKIAMVVELICIAAIFFNKNIVSQVEDAFQTNIFTLLRHAASLDSMEHVYYAAIGVFISFLTCLAALYYVNFFKNILEMMMEDEHPFNIELAKKLRRIAWLMLFTILYSPAIGIVLFLVTLLFSYLFEYGAYLQEKADETQHIQEEIIMSFAEISENKSGQTGFHIKKVAEYSKIIAQELGFDDQQVDYIRLASTMHDIGKLMTPSEILDKPGRLTDEEYAEMKKHTTYGGKMLDNVEGDIMSLARTVALEHHERIDGKGYPEGKSGDDISIEGRIVAVADVYDALTSKRSYKDAWDSKEAYDEIIKCSGTQFDEQVVEAFKRAYDKIEETRRKYAQAAG